MSGLKKVPPAGTRTSPGLVMTSPGVVDVATQGAYDEATRERPETLTDHPGVTSHRRGTVRHALEENRGLTLRDGSYGYETTGYQPGQKGLDPVDDLIAR